MFEIRFIGGCLGKMYERREIMIRKSICAWLIAAGLLLAGCGTQMAGVSPSGPGDALYAAWMSPNAYEMVAGLTFNTDEVDAQMNYGLNYGWFFCKPIEDDQKTPFDLQPFYQCEGVLQLAIGDFEDVENSWAVNAGYCLKQVDDKLTLHAGVFGGIDIGVTAGADYQVLDDLNISADWMTQGALSGVGIAVQYVTPIAEQHLSLLLGLDLDTSTSAGGEALGVGFDYYFNQEFSVGATFGDLTGSVTYEMRAKYYTGPLALGAGYTFQAGPNNDLISAAIEYRFGRP